MKILIWWKDSAEDHEEDVQVLLKTVDGAVSIFVAERPTSSSMLPVGVVRINLNSGPDAYMLDVTPSKIRSGRTVCSESQQLHLTKC